MTMVRRRVPVFSKKEKSTAIFNTGHTMEKRRFRWNGKRVNRGMEPDSFFGKQGTSTLRKNLKVEKSMELGSCGIEMGPNEWIAPIKMGNCMELVHNGISNPKKYRKRIM